MVKKKKKVATRPNFQLTGKTLSCASTLLATNGLDLDSDTKTKSSNTGETKTKPKSEHEPVKILNLESKSNKKNKTKKTLFFSPDITEISSRLKNCVQSIKQCHTADSKSTKDLSLNLIVVWRKYQLWLLPQVWKYASDNNSWRSNLCTCKKAQKTSPLNHSVNREKQYFRYMFLHLFFYNYSKNIWTHTVATTQTFFKPVLFATFLSKETHSVTVW